MHPQELLRAYQNGENITELLRRESNSGTNTEEVIETAYDLQTGSYVRALEDPEMYRHKQDYGAAIAEEIRSLGSVEGILEPGVGEGTTLSFVAKALRGQVRHVHGFDLSWSRIACARDWLAGQGVGNVFLSVASILHAPYADNSFDVVYTSHTIEPNGGNEAPILAELYRIASRYLVLLEPSYELASEEARQRMRRLGYCTGLVEHAEAHGMKVVKHELFPVTVNPLNPTALTVIAKSPGHPVEEPTLVCPRFRTELTEHLDSFYSSGSLRAYPKLRGIPCLRTGDGIIASAFEDVRDEAGAPTSRL